MQAMSAPVGNQIDRVQPDIKNASQNAAVRLLYLFGSQAKGETLPLSDVDFAVQFPPETSQMERAKGVENLIVEFMRLLVRNDIDVVDLDRASPLRRHRVATEGKLLYATDTHAVAEFFVKALREYDDTRSLREAVAAALREGP